MSSTYPRATSLSPSSSILSLGRQGMGNLYCTSQDTEDVQYGYSETRSESEMRRRMLGPMVSGYGPPGSGIGRLTNGNPSEDGYSSSDATVTAIRTNRSRLRAIPSGVVPMQRRRQEDAYNPIDPLTAIDAVKASSNDRGHYANESAGTANRPKQPSRASGDQAIRSKGELFNRNSFLMHQDFTPVRPKPRESESHIHQETYPKTAGKSLDPTVHIPRSFSLDDVMDYPLSADVLRFTRTGVDLANLVSPATDPTIGEAASNINVRKARGIPRIESQNHAGYGARMEHGSEQSFARRRLSEGSSSLVRVSQRPRIQRNTSSDISNRTRPSQRDTSESEGASSPGDWDGPLFSAGSSAFRTLSGGGNMSTGRTSMPDSAWPASPFSEDDRHLSAAQSGTSLRPQAPPPARDGTVLPALLLGLRLLAVVPAVAGSVNLLWQVAQSGTTDTRQLADHFAALPWAILTGVFCFELTSGLTQRWLVHYALAPTLLRMVSLQSLCWPCTYFTLRYVGAVDMLLAWIVVCTTTACSRSIQIWVTSNVPDPIHRTLLLPKGSRAVLSSAVAAVMGSSRRKSDTKECKKLDQGLQARERFWDWEEIGQLVWFPVAILYALTTWFLLLTRIALA